MKKLELAAFFANIGIAVLVLLISVQVYVLISKRLLINFILNFMLKVIEQEKTISYPPKKK